MHIPTLLITSCVPSLILLAGSAVGEAQIAIPVAPDGVYYITALPLVSGYCPCSRKIDLKEGVMINPSDISVVHWQNCFYELRFEPQKLLQAHAPSCALSHCSFTGKTATLFREGGVHLAIENEHQLLYSVTLASEGGGYIEHERIDGADLVFAVASNEQVTCACVRIVGDTIVQTYFDKGVSFVRKGRHIERIEELGTVKGHQKRQLIDALTGDIEQSQIGFFTHSTRPIEQAQDVAFALLDAVRLGLKDELPLLLGGELSGLELPELSEFFGAVERYELAPYCPPGQIIIGVISGEGIQNAVLFAFDCQNDRIVNVSEV